MPSLCRACLWAMRFDDCLASATPAWSPLSASRLTQKNRWHKALTGRIVSRARKPMNAMLDLLKFCPGMDILPVFSTFVRHSQRAAGRPFAGNSD
jgi:hypothetical protein